MTGSRRSVASSKKGSLSDVLAGVREGASLIRSITGMTGEAPTSGGPNPLSMTMPTETARSPNPVFRPLLKDKLWLEEVAFTERDANGVRRSVQSLLDEAIQLLRLGREVEPQASLVGMSVVDFMRQAVAPPRKPGKAGPSEGSKP